MLVFFKSEMWCTTMDDQAFNKQFSQLSSFVKFNLSAADPLVA